MKAVTATPVAAVDPVANVIVGDVVNTTPEACEVLFEFNVEVRPIWSVCDVSTVPDEFVARTVYVYEPATVGVPDNVPPDNVRVPGRLLFTNE